VEIPFIIYTSPLYQQRHPQIMQRIRERQNKSERWNSDELPYLILDLIGVKEVGGETIRNKSMLD
jgi:glucan phosphoethanolaminetransferase (alkaline phosphatase superfamily)